MVMTSVLGHIMECDFPGEYRDWQRIAFEQIFDAPIVTEISSDKKDVAENLRQEARRASLLVIWTDCDREGEYIGAEIAEICRGANARLDVYRARYSVLSVEEVNRAMRSLGRLDIKQVAAAESRSHLDLRSGAAFTRFQTLSFRSHHTELRDQVISYGSCQFPTLGFVVEQYLKVRNFVAEDFWFIRLEIDRAGTKTKFLWRRNRLYDRLSCLILYELCVDRKLAKITRIESKPTSKW